MIYMDKDEGRDILHPTSGKKKSGNKNFEKQSKGMGIERDGDILNPSEEKGE